jgi:hypothetical protein
MRYMLRQNFGTTSPTCENLFLSLRERRAEGGLPLPSNGDEHVLRRRPDSTGEVL